MRACGKRAASLTGRRSAVAVGPATDHAEARPEKRVPFRSRARAECRLQCRLLVQQSVAVLGQLIRQQREKRRVPHRDQAEVRTPDQMTQRRVPERVHVARMADRRRYGHHRPDEPLLKTADVLAVVGEPHRYAGGRHLLARLRGADGPIPRAVEQIGVVQKQIRDPGANAALKLVPEGGGIRNPLGRARRTAGGLEQAHTFAGEHLRLSFSDAGDTGAIVVVVAQGTRC